MAYFILEMMEFAHGQPLSTREDILFITGRSSDSRVVLLTQPSHPTRVVTIAGFRHRLQRRDRAGIAPASLLSSPMEHPSEEYQNLPL